MILAVGPVRIVLFGGKSYRNYSDNAERRKIDNWEYM